MTSHKASTRGVLRETPASPPFTHGQRLPDHTLADAIEHFWHVSWQLPDEAPPFTQRVLSHPSVHLVVEPSRVYIAGIPSACYSRTLTGRGDVFSAKLHPGHVDRLCPGMASDYTDVEQPLDSFMSREVVNALHTSVMNTDDIEARVQHMSTFMRAHLAPCTPAHTLAQRIVAWIKTHPTAQRASHVAAYFDVHERALQRLLAQHVGVTTKWIIRRYRMHEAAARLQDGDLDTLTTLALALGYSDHAHFSNDFKKMTGETPSLYQSRSSTTGDSSGGGSAGGDSA